MDAYKGMGQKKKFNGKFSGKTKKIEESSEAQKAVTGIYGRKWTLSFTEELPFQDGRGQI